MNKISSTTLKVVAAGVFAFAMAFASSASAYTFTTTLKQGSKGAAVQELQKFLNAYSSETVVATSGAGSLGKETTTFGPATKKAVQAFQKKNGLAQVGQVGPATRALLNGTTPVCTVNCNPVQTGLISVSLASTSPVSGTLVAGQATANIAQYTFSNGTSSSVAVRGLKLNRVGISNDTTLSNVYLYEGVNRLTDSASVSSNVITFNDAVGLFTIPANGTKTITVSADVASGTSGQTVGVTLVGMTKVGDSAETAVSVAGNLQSVAVADLATVSFNTTTTPSTASISAQGDYSVWQNVVTVGTREVWMKSLRLRQIGSITNGDLSNFRLYVDGAMVGSAVASLDASGYITFDLSAAPLKMMTGNRTVKVLADIVSGSSRTFSFSMRTTGDAIFTDNQFGVNVLVKANDTTFSARTSGTQTIDTGTLTFTKRTDSPSGNTVDGASNVVLAKYDVKAFGEAMKVENLSFRIDEDDNHTAFTLRNGSVYLDGVQIGSTQALAGDQDSTLAYTNYTFGSSFIVMPGTTRVLEVRADLVDSDGTDEVADADTIQLEIVAGSSNVQRMTALTYGSYPASALEANTLTVATGTLTVANDTSFANRTITAPKYAEKIGSYNIQASTTEGATITSIVVDFDEVADAMDASDDLTNLYLKIGSTTLPIKSTVTDTANTFSTNVAIAAGQTMKVEVYADVASSATNSDGTADTFESSITVSYTTTASATSTAASEVDGQTITAGTGTFTSSLDQSSPFTRLVAGNQEVVAASYKFQASNESYTIKELQVKVGSLAISSVINSVQFYNGSTPVGAPAVFAQSSNTAALVTGLNILVPADQSVTITAKLMLNTIGTGAGTSQSDAALTLDSVKYADSQGVETTSGTDRAGNSMYVFKSIPTVTQEAAGLASGVNGNAVNLYKFKVTADAKGAVALKQFKLATTWSDVGTDSTLAITNIKLLEDGSDVTSSTVSIVDEDGNNVESSGFAETDGTLVVSWDSGYESIISAGQTKTYTVRGTLSGFVAETDEQNSVTFALNGDSSANGTSMYLNDETDQAGGQSEIWELFTSAAASSSDGTAANFIWSDMSASGHVSTGNATSTSDWANGYKVLNLDLDSETFATVL